MKNIRTKPNKNNRPLLQSVKSAGILRTEKIGIRNIVNAERQIVINHGLDVPNIDGKTVRPLNFHPYYPIRSNYVIHEGASAFLSATPGHIDCFGQPGDPSSLFAPNPLADELFKVSKPGNDTYVGSMGRIFGDAVLITDTRQHWVVCPRRLTAPTQADDLAASLTTPHLRSKSRWGTGIPDIVFLEEPCADDLIQLTMMFG